MTQDKGQVPEALLEIAREIEALKRPCGMDPESSIAMQNGRYVALSYKVRALAAQAISADPAGVVVVECGNLYAKVKLVGDAFGTTTVGDKFYATLAPRVASHGQAPAQPDALPFGYFHQLLNHEGEGNGVWLGTAKREVVEQSHTPGETGEEIVALYAAATPTPQAADTGAAQPNPWLSALQIRMAQGWKLKGDRVPVLYTDTINGDGVGRDDLWLCTTEALAHVPAQGAGITEEECNKAALELEVADLAAPQPAPPADSQKAPVRKIEDCPELNMSNYDDVDVGSLSDWATRASDEIDRLSAARAQADSVTAPAGGVAESILAAARSQLSQMRAQRKSLEGFLALGNEVSRAALLDEEIQLLAGALDATQAADSVLEDAARYQWLRQHWPRQHWFTMSSNYKGCITFRIGEPRWSDITEEALDAAIDSARKQGCSHAHT